MQLNDIALFDRPFIYLRHGETESNAAKLIAGSWDVALTRKGLAQAGQAALKLKGVGIDAIHSSALSRARDTADIIAQELDLPVTAIPELNERCWGALERQPRSSRVPGMTVDGLEPALDFMNRVTAGFRRVEGRLPLIVAHSGIYRVLCRMLGLPEAEQPVANCTPLRFTPPAPGFNVWRVEALGH